MSPNPCHNTFWLSYQPVDDESLEETLEVVDKVLKGDVRSSSERDYGFFGGQMVRDGQRVVDLVICTPIRRRVTAIYGKQRWQRCGARGSVSDLKYPFAGEKPHDFLQRWSRKVKLEQRYQLLRGASEDKLFQVLEDHQRRESGRMLQRKTSRPWRESSARRRKALRKPPTPSPPSSLERSCHVSLCSYPPSTQVAVHQEVSGLETGMSNIHWSPHDFGDVTLPVEGVLFFFPLFMCVMYIALTIGSKQANVSAGGQLSLNRCMPCEYDSTIDMLLEGFGFPPRNECLYDLGCDRYYGWNDAIAPVNIGDMSQNGMVYPTWDCVV